MSDNAMWFDAVNGTLWIPLIDSCYNSANIPPCSNAYTPNHTFCWLAVIEGFPTLDEIELSYAPRTNSLGFTFPIRPEGFVAADRFDTYIGEVTRPLDLSQAQSLQCAYPSAPAHPGDYLTITPPVPTPAPGHAKYVLTAVTFQGQTRAGRSAIDGHLQGRDASVLPPCVIEKFSVSAQNQAAR